MSALFELLLVFAGIYLFDCVHWARRETVAFRAWWGRRHRLVAGEDLLGNERYGLVLAQPLLPFGRVYLTEALPLSLTEETATSFVVTAMPPGPRPPQVERVVPLTPPPRVLLEARRVLVDGRLFVEAGSPRAARRIAALLGELAGLSAQRRARRLDRLVSEALDTQAVERRLEECERASRALRSACLAEFVFVFAAVPALAHAFGLARVWLPLVGTLIALQAVVTWLFVRAHREVYPEERRARRGEAFLLALSPPSAMRSCDALSRDLLCEFHPLCVASVVLDRERFAAFAERFLRDALHPLPLVREAAGEGVREAAEEWRKRIVPALEAFLAARGLAGRPWREPPARLASDCRTFCPRCTQQFTLAGGACERCQGLPLESFGPA